MSRYRLAIFGFVIGISLAACQQPTPTTQAPTPTDVAEITEQPHQAATDAPDSQVTREPATGEVPTIEATPEGPFPGAGPWEVTFDSADGSTLHGTVYGQGTTAVILAPMYNVGETAWQPFAEEVATEDFRVLTFDYRGVGDSEGTRNPATASEDLAAAVAFMRANQFDPVILVGAGLGGAAAIRVAAQDSTILGAALVSAPRSFPPETADALAITDAELGALRMPTLWLGTRNDMTQNVEEMFEKSAGSDKTLWIYEGSAMSGTFIFDEADGDDLRRRLIEFIHRVAGA